MTVFADDARRIIQNMPRRIPKYVNRELNAEKIRTRWQAYAATEWLHEVNGDPRLGRSKREMRKEIYGEEEETVDDLADMEAMRQDRDATLQEPPEVKIENPPATGMPRAYLEGLSAVQFSIAAQIAHDDTVASRWEVIGTHSGTFLGCPASGGDVTVAGVTVLRFAETRDDEDKLAYMATEEWTCWDLPSVLQQIGAIS